MRWRAVGAVLGAAVLAGAVVVLRDQAPLPDAAPPVDAGPAALRPTDGGLPVREPQRAPRWRLAASSTPAFDAIVSREHIAYVDTGDGLMTFTLTSRERPTGAPVVRHSVPTSAPWSAVLRDGMLVVTHGNRPLVQVTAIDARSGAVTELAAPPGYAFRARLAVLGDDVLAAGRPATGPRACVFALRPREGTSRVVWCSADDRLGTSLQAGEHSALWPSTAPTPGRCSQWSRLLAGAVEPLGAAVPAALCAARGVVDSGGWLVGVRSGRGDDVPVIVAASGREEVRLGAAADVTPCGRHVYWTAHGGGPDDPVVVYRWRPGAAEREVAYRVDDIGNGTVGVPRCADGMLSVVVLTADAGSRTVEVRTLGRP